MFEALKENLLSVQKEIEPYTPRIIAVTKYFGQDAIQNAYDAGIRDFGESRAVEATEKILSLPAQIRSNSTFHFIGHLQTNKVKYVLKVFEYIHSVDSLKLAKCISENAAQIGKVQKILVQINNAEEEQKYGFSKTGIFDEFEEIINLKNIKVVGVMNMAPLDAQEDEIRRLFSEIRQIRNDLENRFNCKLEEISMGMSQDYKIAAQEGSTMLRIGRKLFT